MNVNIGAVIAYFIAFLTAMLAVLQQDDVSGVQDIGQKTWIIIIVGPMISFLKDHQAVNTRRVISLFTKSDQGIPAAPPKSDEAIT